MIVDGKPITGNVIPLSNDKGEHRVVVELG